MKDFMREEFEKDWGFTNEEQECYFIPELNCYGSARVNKTAESKSYAWTYFQRGWKASRECLVIELPLIQRDDYANTFGMNCAIEATDMMKVIIHSAGVKTK